MMTTRKNPQTKALQSAMAKAKKHSFTAHLEWLMSCNTNSARGRVFDQSDFHELYSRRSGDARGASKVCHLYSHEGNKFEYIVVKRHKPCGYIPNANGEHAKCTGNQLIDEINCWVEFAERPEADYLCPILKYFTSKSDKVTATSEKMQYNVVIIAQKAVYVSDASDACRKAEELNRENGLNGENHRERYAKLAAMSNERGWRDAMWNGGNSGVIFDYAKGYYKAVFIDYAL